MRGSSSCLRTGKDGFASSIPRACGRAQTIAGCRSSSANRCPSLKVTKSVGPTTTTSAGCSTPTRRGSWPSTQRRSEEHTSELQSLMRISYAVFCLKKKKQKHKKEQKMNTRQTVRTNLDESE